MSTDPEIPQMRMEAAPTCPACGATGAILFARTIDHTFNVSGVFSVRRCSRADCQTVWMDPRPIKEDIHLAYRQYYTHEAPGIPGKDASRVGATRRGTGVKGRFEHAIGLTSERAALSCMFLNTLPPGKVLEIGCGAGVILRRLRNLGWDVTGQDVDPMLAAPLEKDGIRVVIGEVEDADFAEGAFDAVISNHVFEHVHDGLAHLVTYRRLLRAGGIVVITTPNSRAASIRRFGDHWAGIDAPRHIAIYSTDALKTLAQSAGYARAEAWTTNARREGISRNSRYNQRVARAGKLLKRTPNRTDIAVERLRQYSTQILRSKDHDDGDECVLIAYR